MTLPVINIEEVKTFVDATLEALQQELRELNYQIWSNPELAYQEQGAHDTICDFLEGQGFTVTRHAYGLDTSFEVLSGTGGRLINFNAEYDALPGIGHACGHNLIATSSIAAFLALSHPGPKKIYPDQEPSDGIAGTPMNARKEYLLNAHAGGNPWEGINALDALVSSYNNVAVLRQQLLPDQRVHCAFLDTPKVANVIPDYTKAFWQVRSPTLKGLNTLVSKLRNCIEAGALATGCQVKIDEDELYTDVRLNDTLCERYCVHMGRYSRKVLKRYDKVLTGSSDIGNVSYETPTLHTMFAIPAPTTSFPHHPTFAAAAGTDEAHAEALIVGKSLALIGWDMIAENDMYDLAWRQWKDEIARED
ncbi:Peptidase M20D amidohydrolase predicted [Penicillium expansum]|nr:Peptidase M20D amidohydrolase predicted [Penicillium expansum]